MLKSSQQTSGGYGGLGTIGKDIMVRDSKELVPDFSKKIREIEKNGKFCKISGNSIWQEI